MRGAALTLYLWLGSAILSLSLGIVSGIVRSKQWRPNLLAYILDVITFVLRGIPFYVQLLIAYFVVPNLLGFAPSAETTSIIALGLCSAAYTSQTVRGCIDALPLGQWEACAVLGYSRYQTLRFVILPQAMRTMLPTLTNELDQLLKSTTIISSIGVLELTRVGMNIIARDMKPLPAYLTIAAIYLIISSLLQLLGQTCERKAAYVSR